MVVFEANRACLGSERQCQQLIKWIPTMLDWNVSILYLLPVQQRGQLKAFGSPYCIQDFWKWDDQWGNDDDWNVLVNTCQKYNIRIVLDWVMNHTSWDHQWLDEAHDFYLHDENGNNMCPPGTAWTDVVQLDTRNPLLVRVMTDLMLKWVKERGVGGFRWDAMNRIPREVRKTIQLDIKAQCDDLIWIGDESGISPVEEHVDFLERKWTSESFDDLMKNDNPFYWTYLHHHDEANVRSWKEKVKGLDQQTLMQNVKAINNPVLSMAMWESSAKVFNWGFPCAVAPPLCK